MKLNKLFAFLLFAIGILGISCGGDDNELSTIAETAADTDNLSTLVAALERTELTSVLDGTADFTVFAPTNAAFDAFLEVNNFNALEDIPVEALKNVLLNHVISGKTLSSGLATGYIPTQATTGISTKNIDMYVNTEGGVNLNGQSQVTSADIEATNGVVHVVNSVIVPATIVTFATADATFSTLVSALTREADYPFVDLLGATGEFTVFAPTNDAFGDLLTELDVDALADIDADLLSNVLSYHVVSGANVLAGSLSDGQTISPLLTDATFEIDLDNGAQIIDGSGRTTDIIITDVQASNGVIHAVNQVILPAL